VTVLFASTELARSNYLFGDLVHVVNYSV